MVWLLFLGAGLLEIKHMYESLALIDPCLPFDHYLEKVHKVFEIFLLDQILQKLPS